MEMNVDGELVQHGSPIHWYPMPEDHYTDLQCRGDLRSCIFFIDARGSQHYSCASYLDI